MAVMVAPKGEPRELPPLEPAQRPSLISGVLYERQETERDAAGVISACLATIAGHLRHTCDWPGAGWKIGDANCYTVTTAACDGLVIVMTFCTEPGEDAHWQIAAGPPGTVLDRTRRDQLTQFGFGAGRESGRWDRDIRITTHREAAAAATELLALLCDVFGYRGLTPLTFTLAQNERAEAGALYRTLSAEDVRKLLHGWGYRAEIGATSSGNPVVRSGASGFKFHILFAWPSKDEHLFGCLNFVTVFVGRPNLTLSIVNEISKTSRFSRLYLDEENDLILERDVALTGGVSLAYLQECLLDWTFMMESTTKKLDRLVIAPEVVPILVH